MPLCQNFARKIGYFSGQTTRVSGVLGQKLGYDRSVKMTRFLGSTFRI